MKASKGEFKALYNCTFVYLYSFHSQHTGGTLSQNIYAFSSFPSKTTFIRTITWTRLASKICTVFPHPTARPQSRNAVSGVSAIIVQHTHRRRPIHTSGYSIMHKMMIVVGRTPMLLSSSERRETRACHREGKSSPLFWGWGWVPLFSDEDEGGIAGNKNILCSWLSRHNIEFKKMSFSYPSIVVWKMPFSLSFNDFFSQNTSISTNSKTWASPWAKTILLSRVWDGGGRRRDDGRECFLLWREKRVWKGEKSESLVTPRSLFQQEKKKSRWKNFLVQMWGRRERDRIALARPSKDARVTSRPLFPSPPSDLLYVLTFPSFFLHLSSFHLGRI